MSGITGGVSDILQWTGARTTAQQDAREEAMRQRAHDFDMANLSHDHAKEIQDIAHAFSKESAATAYERQLAMENTKFQRQKADMIASGINPMLMTGAQPPQSNVPQGATGVTASGSGRSSSGVSIPSGPSMGNTAFELSRLIESQRKNIEADTALKQGETSKLPYEKALLVAQEELTKGELRRNQVESLFVQARTKSEEKQAAILEFERQAKAFDVRYIKPQELAKLRNEVMEGDYYLSHIQQAEYVKLLKEAEKIVSETDLTNLEAVGREFMNIILDTEAWVKGGNLGKGLALAENISTIVGQFLAALIRIRGPKNFGGG